MIHFIYSALALLIQQVPDVEGVEWYVRQDDFGEPIVRKDRAVYVEFAPTSWIAGGRGVQFAEIRITLHIVTSNRLATHQAMTQAALQRTALVDAIYQKVQGKGLGMINDQNEHCELTNALTRVEQSYAHTHSKLTTDTLSFRCMATDSTALRQMLQTVVSPEIETRLSSNL